MKRRVVFLGTIFFLIGSVSLLAQDVPFIWGHHWGVGARALSMGGAYTGIADDYAALYYNPAGLGQIQSMEISGSLAYVAMTDRATFLGLETPENSSFTRLNSIGIALPVPTTRGSLVFAFGYNRLRDFDHSLYVTKFISTPGDSVTHEYNELEEGGLQNISLGGSIEMAPGVFLGGSINFWTGGDDWTWRFTESDSPYDIWTFTDFVSTDHINTKFSGVNLTLSTLFHTNDFSRFGCAIITPVTLTGKENWDYSEITDWDNGVRSVDSTDNGYSEYKIQSPWIFRAGGAFQAGPLLVSGDIEWNNYNQIKYKTNPPEDTYSMADVNLEIKRKFRNTFNIKAGAELSIPSTSVKIRAGYAFYPSPLKNTSLSMDRRVFSFGAGFTFAEQFGVDFGYASTSWDGVPGDVIQQEKIAVNKILINFSYHM